MIWILLILGIAVIILLSGCKPTVPIPPPDPVPPPIPNPEPPLPDPLYYRWHLVDTTTERWTRYFAYMQKITKDSLMALEMLKHDENGKHFYIWTEEVGPDYWETPDETWEKGKVDCDGFARLTADGLGRFAKYPEVWWLEYYGYYRYYDAESGEFKIEYGGHAITVYRKDEKLLAFSNTNWWWNENFQDFVSIGELAFPEGIVYIRCRHWETGKLQWIAEAPDNEILEASNIFDRDKKVIPDAPKFDKNNLPDLN